MKSNAQPLIQQDSKSDAIKIKQLNASKLLQLPKELHTRINSYLTQTDFKKFKATSSQLHGFIDAKFRNQWGTAAYNVCVFQGIFICNENGPRKLGSFTKKPPYQATLQYNCRESFLSCCIPCIDDSSALPSGCEKPTGVVCCIPLIVCNIMSTGLGTCGFFAGAIKDKTRSTCYDSNNQISMLSPDDARSLPSETAAAPAKQKMI